MRSLKFIKLLSFLFVLSLMIVSCGKEGMTTEEEIPGEFTPTETQTNDLITRSTTSASEGGLDLDCVTVIYPFDLVDSEGGTHTVASEEDFLALVSDNPEVIIVDFVYPLTVAHEGGEQSEVADAQELGELFANCLPNGWDADAFPAYLINSDNSCLDLQFPLTVTDLQGETQVFDDEEAFVAGLAAEPLFFSFPMSLTDQDGETIVVGDYQELLTALFACNNFDVDTTIWNDGGFEYIGCYQLTFPFELELIDGSVVTVDDHMEYCDLLLSGEVAGFAFPLTLTDDDGEIVVVNTQEELDELVNDCYGFDGGSGGGSTGGDLGILLIGTFPIDSSGMPCYTVEWPIDAIQLTESGEEIQTVTINSSEEVFELPGIDSGEFFYDVVWPVTVIMNDGTVVTPNGAEDIFEVLSVCQ